MTREFNTAGPMVASDHYLVPPLSRVDPRRTARARAAQAVLLRAARAAPDGEDVHPAGPAGSAEREAASTPACTRTSRWVRRRGRTSPTPCAPCSASSRGRAYRTLGDRTLDEIFPGALERVGPNAALTEALALWAAAAPKPLVLLIDEIDSLDRRHAAGRAAAVARGVRRTSERLPAQRDPVRRAGRAGLPRPLGFGERRLVLGGSAFNIKLGVAAARRFLRGGDAGSAGAAHGGDGADVHPGGPGGGPDPHGGPALAGERAVLRRLLPTQPSRPRPVPRDHRGRHRGSPRNG